MSLLVDDAIRGTGLNSRSTRLSIQIRKYYKNPQDIRVSRQQYRLDLAKQ